MMCLRTAAAALVAIFASVGGVANSAHASMLHPAVVIENPVDYTSSLVATETVPRPHVDAIAQVGNTILAGGLFDRVARPGGALSYFRQNFMAFDATTGAMKTNIVPSFDAQIWAIETFGNAVYVGGAFATVSGTSRRSLVKLDAATGRVDPLFNANFPGGVVWDLKVWQGPNGSTPMLVVGGTMGKKLIALDLATGKPILVRDPTTGRSVPYFDLVIADAIPGAWGGVAIYKLAINPAGSKLVATGNFRTVGAPVGTLNRTRLFVADLTGPKARLDPWYYPGFAKPCASTHPRRIAYLQGVDFDPTGSYFVVTATGQIPASSEDIWPSGSAQYHTVCDAAARFNLADDDRPVWINYTGGDSVWSVAVTGPAVYVQGHFQWLDNPKGFASQDGGGAARRLGIGAIHPVSGKALLWDPPAPAAIGGKAFLATSSGLWAVSDSERFNNEPRRGMAFLPLPPH